MEGFPTVLKKVIPDHTFLRATAILIILKLRKMISKVRSMIKELVSQMRTKLRV